MIYIYILELCNNKYYIGKLYDIYKLEDTILMLDETIEWLYYNKIKKISSIEQFDQDVDERFFIYEFIQHYGVNNVRGDSFNKMKLTLDNIYDIFTYVKIEFNKCYLCGKNEHNGFQCKLRYKYGYDLLVMLIMSNIICFNCNMKGHYKEHCKIKKTLDIII